MSDGAGPDSIVPDIGGGWDGVYAYGGRQHRPPARFVAAFSVADSAGGFVGVITDAGGIGEAGVTGTVEGGGVRFVKTYRWSRAPRTAPIHYQGTFSEDGQAAEGAWQINSRFFGLISQRAEGTWRMQRPTLPEMQTVWPPPPQAFKG